MLKKYACFVLKAFFSFFTVALGQGHKQFGCCYTLFTLSLWLLKHNQRQVPSWSKSCFPFKGPRVHPALGAMESWRCRYYNSH